MSTVLMLGDLWLRNATPSLCQIDEPFVLNLEAPVTKSGCPQPRKVNLRSDSLSFSASFGRDPVAVSLANNHCMDFGSAGLMSTIEFLISRGIAFFGAGSSHENANNPVVVAVGSHRLGLCGYVCPTTHPVFATTWSPGVHPIDPVRIGEDVAEARRRGADRVAVFLHWGVEEVNLPRPADRKVAREIVAQGPDIVIGGHAHVTQGWEYVDRTPVYYGLGNFAFADIHDPGFFDEGGAPGQIVRKRWRKWNRESLGVRYNLLEGTSEIVTFIEAAGRINARANLARWERELFPLSRLYDRQFARAHAYGIIRSKIGAYLSAPKVPRWRHLRSLTAIADEARIKTGSD